MSSPAKYWGGVYYLQKVLFSIPCKRVPDMYHIRDIQPDANYSSIYDSGDLFEKRFRLQHGNWHYGSDLEGSMPDTVATFVGEKMTGQYVYHDLFQPHIKNSLYQTYDTEVWWTGPRTVLPTATIDMNVRMAHGLYTPDTGPGTKTFIFSNNTGDKVINTGMKIGGNGVTGGGSNQLQSFTPRDPDTGEFLYTYVHGMGSKAMNNGDFYNLGAAPNTDTYTGPYLANHYVPPSHCFLYWAPVMAYYMSWRGWRGGGVGGGGGIPIPRPPRPPAPGPGTPGGGGTGGPGNGTSSSVLSCGDCGPCKVTSKPWVVGKINGSGVPTTIEQCNVTVAPISGETCSALLYINAPVKQEEYRVTQILFWAGIDKNGKLVSLSEPLYKDQFANLTEDSNIMCLPSSMMFTPGPGVPTSQFNTYEIRPLGVRRTTNDMNKLREEIRTPSDSHYDEMRMWDLKDGIGTIQFNPVTQKFQNVNLTPYQFTTLSRTLTAAKYDGSSSSVLYCPSDGMRPHIPITLADGTQYIGWENQGTGFSTDICYDVEWLTLDPTLTGYGDYVNVIPAGLNPAPTYVTTSNTRVLTGYYISNLVGQGGISLGRNLSRPRGRASVSTGTMSHHHHDHRARRYDMYSSTDGIINTDVSFKDFGHTFFTNTVPGISGNKYAISTNSYPETTVPSITAKRMISEFGSSNWDIADFTMFTGLSAPVFALFLTVFDKMSLYSSMTADYAAIELIGYCTYNGSLTAADGKYYCAAIARGNIPTWCQSVTGIGNNVYENFVICTSGCDLVLPYIGYRRG